MASRGHHLMRVRILERVFEKLQEVAEEESDRTGEHVTVSDLVRVACYDYLLVYDSARRLESLREDLADGDEDEDEEEDCLPVKIDKLPML